MIKIRLSVKENVTNQFKRQFKNLSIMFRLSRRNSFCSSDMKRREGILFTSDFKSFRESHLNKTRKMSQRTQSEWKRIIAQISFEFIFDSYFVPEKAKDL